MTGTEKGLCGERCRKEWRRQKRTGVYGWNGEKSADGFMIKQINNVLKKRVE